MFVSSRLVEYNSSMQTIHVCMCVCTYVCVCVCTYVCVCVCTYVCVCMYICMCMCIYCVVSMYVGVGYPHHQPPEPSYCPLTNSPIEASRPTGTNTILADGPRGHLLHEHKIHLDQPHPLHVYTEISHTPYMYIHRSATLLTCITSRSATPLTCIYIDQPHPLHVYTDISHTPYMYIHRDQPHPLHVYTSRPATPLTCIYIEISHTPYMYIHRDQPHPLHVYT